MLYTLPDKSQEYWSKEGLHRQEGPAVIRSNGTEEWWFRGIRHRLGGPAVEHLSGYQAYYKQGKLHREDGPARIFADGSSEHYLEGKLQEDERGERARDLSESDVVAFYETGTEDDRLHGNGFPTMEFERARRAILKILPREKQEVLDIGGGPGLYAGWLAALGHSVTLLEPVPEHIYRAQVRAAQGASFEALLGDALELPLPDESFDFIVMFGPMYHLQEDGQRQRALREAFRVLRPGGSLILSALNRHAPLIQGAATGLLEVPSYRRAIAGSNPILQGSHHPLTPRGEWFEVSYGHGTRDL